MRLEHIVCLCGCVCVFACVVISELFGLQEGMKQHFAVGQYLRQRYIEGQPYKLLSTEYDRFEVSFVAQ